MKKKIILTIAIMVLALTAFADAGDVQVNIGVNSDPVTKLELYLMDGTHLIYPDAWTGTLYPGDHHTLHIDYSTYLDGDTVKIVAKGGIGESSYSRTTNNWDTLYFTVYLDDGNEPPPDPGTGSGID